MKVVYHPRFEEVYNSDPAAKAGRMEAILKEVSPHYEVMTAEPAALDDVRLVHSDEHIKDMRRIGLTYELALLAAGGTIEAAKLAMSGEPAFALVRPPGHHASPEHCWGFCFFNNMAISIAKLRKEYGISKALILDIDLHFGDGTDNFFRNTPDVLYFHPEARDRKTFIDSISTTIDQSSAEIVAVSAGFDRHKHDWGGLLETEDYETIGALVKSFSQRVCQGRRYGVLEGGYNHQVLGKNVKAFLSGLE